MKRRTPSIAALLALVAFVFAQVLAAAYACDMGTPAQVVAMADGTAPDCCDPAMPSMDPACDNHCQQANKAPERVQVSSAPALDVGTIAMVAAVAAPAIASPTHHARPPDLARHISPPISIRNCCFRI